MLHLYLKKSEVSKDNYRSVISPSNIYERCIYGQIQTYFDKSLSNNNTFCAPLTQKVLLLINLSQKKNATEQEQYQMFRITATKLKQLVKPKAYFWACFNLGVPSINSLYFTKIFKFLLKN